MTEQTGTKTLENFLVHPQGAATRRVGTKFIAEVKNSAAKTRLIPFEFSTTQSYMLAFVKNTTSNTRMFVFANGQQITNINSTGNDYLDCALGDIDLDRLYFTQSADTLILVHEDMSLKSIEGVLYNFQRKKYRSRYNCQLFKKSLPRGVCF